MVCPDMQKNVGGACGRHRVPHAVEIRLPGGCRFSGALKQLASLASETDFFCTPPNLRILGTRNLRLCSLQGV